MARGRRGRRVENVEQGQPIRIGVVFEARHDLEAPVFGFHFSNADGVAIFGFNRTLPDVTARTASPPGSACASAAQIENPLLPGRYFVTCLVSRNRAQGDLAIHRVRLLDFVVYGTRPGPGACRCTPTSTAELEVSDDALELREVRGPSALGGGLGGARSTCST